MSFVVKAVEVELHYYHITGRKNKTNMLVTTSLTCLTGICCITHLTGLTCLTYLTLHPCHTHLTCLTCPTCCTCLTCLTCLTFQFFDYKSLPWISKVFTLRNGIITVDSHWINDSWWNLHTKNKIVFIWKYWIFQKVKVGGKLGKSDFNTPWDSVAHTAVLEV